MERIDDRLMLADQLALLRKRSGGRVVWPITAIVTADNHVGSENSDLGDPNERQLVAVDSIATVPFPLGGFCGTPTWKLVDGDVKHEATEDLSRAIRYYRDWHWTDGNHDQDDVRDYIVGRFGSLNWGYSVGGVYFQAMTENYIDESHNYPPSPEQIEMVKTMLLARPAVEPKVIVVHRALSGSYPREWVGSDQTYTYGATPYTGTNDPDGVPTDSLTPFLEMLAEVPGIILVMHGHDHYKYNYLGNTINWPEAAALSGLRFISPGSVRQAGEAPGYGPEGPYSVTYPEAFLVLRIWPDRIEYGCYQWGFSQTPDTYPPGRVYAPGVWLFSGSVSRTP